MTTLYWVLTLVSVKVGSLDDRSDFKVQADIWMKSAPPWHRPHDGARQIEGNVAATPRTALVHDDAVAAAPIAMK
ncbi:MAG TPA: hypothetical protein VEL76_18025 [Gemmataceae bacterium]|nr:hypothetical protein [Gemmataceae bacterium]